MSEMYNIPVKTESADSVGEMMIVVIILLASIVTCVLLAHFGVPYVFSR